MSVSAPLAPLHLPVPVLLPVPVCEPPYDDELAEPDAARPPSRPRVGPLRALAPLRLVPPPSTTPAPAPPPPRPLPPVRPVAAALVQGLLEVLAGVRTVSQLKASTSPELFERLEALVHGRPRTTGSRPSTCAVRSLHVQQHAPGIAEVCATVRRGRRAGALALRLELVDGRWRCTAAEGL